MVDQGGSQSVQEMHDIYVLIGLTLVLAIVWRMKPSKIQSQIPVRKRSDNGKPGFYSNSYGGMLCGVIIGLLLAQVPRLMLSSGSRSKATGLASLAGSEAKEDDYVATCKIPRQGVPSGAEGLPPGIIQPTSDLFVRRLWGRPEEDLPSKPKYLLVLSVRLIMMEIVDKMMSKFTSEWMVMLFHGDGKMDEWLEFDWTPRAIHVVGPRQSKWWFAKRFLHPDVVEPFEYVFVFMGLMKEHKLEIAQPAVKPPEGTTLTWQLIKHRADAVVHKFVEIQAPVFSRAAWRCVWHMIQNDLVHAWGLDFNLWRCAQGPPHEVVGVIDTEYISSAPISKKFNSQDGEENEKQVWDEIQGRCKYEWDIFKGRMATADAAASEKKPPSDSTIEIF
eukprot:jgi/Mesen1/7421/ME000388S06642